MRLLKHLLLTSFLLTSIVSIGQIDWEHPLLELTERDGLPSTYYKDFEEDEFGFLWISTFSGVCRFDGSKLMCLQDTLLPNDGFTELVYDKNRQLLWIGSFEGLFSYNVITEEVKSYQHEAPERAIEVTSLCLIDGKELWVGTLSTIAKLSTDSDALENIKMISDQPEWDRSFHSIKSICQDPIHANRLWLSTSGGIIQYYRKENKAVYANPEIGNRENLGVNQIYAPKNTNHLYFGIDKHNSKKNSYNYLVYDVESEKPMNAISINDQWDNRKIVQYQDSLLFFTTSMGLVRYNHFEQKVSKVYLNEGKGITNYKVDFVDSKANIWSANQQSISMYNTGKSYGKSYFYKSAFPGWYHVVSDLCVDTENNKLYMAVFGGEGLYEFDLRKKTWKIYPFLDPETGDVLKTTFVDALQFEEGKLMLFSNGGIFEINELGHVVKSDFQIEGHGAWLSAYRDSQQNLWATVSKEKVVKFDLETNEMEELTDKVHYCAKGTGHNFFYEDTNTNIWIGGYCEGFDCYDQETGKVYSFDIPNPEHGESVMTFAEKDGFMWAQTDIGILYKMDIHHLEKGILEIVDLKMAVRNGVINLLNDETFSPETTLSGTFDRLGRFWFISEKGMYRYDIIKKELELFDQELGIQVIDPEMNVFVSENLVLLPDGNMAFSSRKGVCLFDPENITNSEESPSAYITAINVNNQKIKSDSSSFLKSFYEFGPRENFIGFDFSALSFSNPGNIKFEYKLASVDEDWKNPGDKRFVSYTQLKGGDYTFLLRAAGPSGLWQAYPTSLNLHIAKLWYQTSWAKGLILAIIIFSILYSYFSRLNRAIEKEHLKTEYERDLAELKMQALTAQMNPHFIFNSLNSIDFYIIKNDAKKASQYLNRFSRLIRLILKNSRSNYITLKDDLDALKLYLEIESLRFNHQFNYEIQISENIDQDYLKIPPMLIQPYVENAIWHGLLHKKENGKIKISFSFNEEDEVLKCVVEDNGIGRKRSMEAKVENKKTKNRKSFGMNITMDKIEAINFLHDTNAAVEIIDLYNKENEGVGTKVELNIPV